MIELESEALHLRNLVIPQENFVRIEEENGKIYEGWISNSMPNGYGIAIHPAQENVIKSKF